MTAAQRNFSWSLYEIVNIGSWNQGIGLCGGSRGWNQGNANYSADKTLNINFNFVICYFNPSSKLFIFFCISILKTNTVMYSISNTCDEDNTLCDGMDLGLHDQENLDSLWYSNTESMQLNFDTNSSHLQYIPLYLKKLWRCHSILICTRAYLKLFLYCIPWSFSLSDHRCAKYGRCKTWKLWILYSDFFLLWIWYPRCRLRTWLHKNVENVIDQRRIQPNPPPPWNSIQVLYHLNYLVY